MKEGLRETAGVSKTLDVDLFIAMLRTLVVELELRLENEAALQLPKEPK